MMRCETAVEQEGCLAVVQARPWFRSHGALAQELQASSGTDLRLVVAGQRVVGAAERHAAPGQWRTNVSLGGTPTPARPPVDACRLGASAAEALGADLVGIDLFPTPAGGYVVLEANGAVDFLDLYSFPAAMSTPRLRPLSDFSARLRRPPVAQPRRSATSQSTLRVIMSTAARVERFEVLTRGELQQRRT